MILELRAKNCFVFQNQIVFSLDPFNKTTAIYGPNNVGKSCLIKCIQVMKDILLNKKVKLTSNLFSNNSICELGITFLYRDMKYSYDIKYDTKLNQFIYESLTSKDIILYKRDLLNQIFDCKDEETKKFMFYMVSDNVLFHVMNTEYMKNIKDVFVSFAHMMDIISTTQWNGSSGAEKLISLLKHIEPQRIFIVDNLDDGLDFGVVNMILEMSTSSQLIFVAYNTSISNCDEYWFIHRENENVYVYSFDNIDSVMELYKEGMISAISEPSLIEWLIDLKRFKCSN